MALESEEEYVARRFREARPYEKENGWTKPDRWDRPTQFSGMDGGGTSYSTPIIPVQQPIVNGQGSNTTGGGGSGTNFDTIVNGSRQTYNFLGNFV